MRNPQLKEGYLYHVFTKSIAGYTIFRNHRDYKRFLDGVQFYRFKNPPVKLSAYLRYKDKEKFHNTYLQERPLIVDIIAYCIMPTHVHFVLSQLEEGGISYFMKNLLDSYTRYFNSKNDRKGPLWQGRFKSVLIENEEQLMHTTRYIHLNPTTDNLVERPEDWQYSSYNEYIGKSEDNLCTFSKYFSILPDIYSQFVNDQIEYQQAIKFHLRSGTKGAVGR